MERRKKFYGAILALLLVVILLVLMSLLYPPEQRYNGRTTSTWCSLWWEAELQGNTNADAIHALRQIGTNGIPYALSQIRYKPSTLGLRARNFLATLSGKTHRNQLSKAEKQAGEASAVFMALGAQAAPAIPELAVLAQSNDSFVRDRALLSLGGIGDEALPFFQSSLSNHSNPACVNVVALLAIAYQHFRFSTNAKILIAPLESLTNSNPTIAELAIDAATNIRLQE